MKREHCDVLVAGGGLAGVAAACTAARLGARTLLLERGPALGGQVTSALVHTICGLYEPGGEAPCLAHEGFAARFADSLRRAGAAAPPERAAGTFVLPISPSALGARVTRLCEATPRLDVRLHAAVAAAELARETPAASLLRLEHRGQHTELEARALIDATGDGALGALGGAAFEIEPPARLQHASFIVHLWGVADDELAGFGRLRVSATIGGAARHGALPAECGSVLLRPGLRAGEAFLTLTLPKEPGDAFAPLDEAWQRGTTQRGHRLAAKLLRFLRAERPGFARAEIAGWPRRVGVRETRRLLGREVMTGEDVRSGRKRDDGVARSSWPIELWHDAGRVEIERIAAPADVPLGALASRTHAGLWMAGRCLSATHEAHGALRVLATAMATGEAAGAAAAMQAAGGDVSPQRVREAIARLATEESAAW